MVVLSIKDNYIPVGVGALLTAVGVSANRIFSHENYITGRTMLAGRQQQPLVL